MQRKSQPAPKPYHHGDLKHALIEAGVNVLAELGVERLNLREVARVAGVSHAAPYRHFVDKQALVAAIAEDGFNKLAAEINRVAAKPFANSAGKLIAAGQAYIRFALQHPDHFRIMFSSVGERVENSGLYHVSKVGFVFLTAVIEAGQATGELRPGDSLEITKAMWAMMHGLATLIVEEQFAPDPRKPVTRKQAEEIAASYIEMMLKGLRA